MPRAVPNKKNNVKLTPAKAAQAQAAIKNFIPNIPWPPVTATAKAQMEAAVAAYTAQVNQVQRASAAQLSSGTSGNGAPLSSTVQAAASNPRTLPAAQLAVQENTIGSIASAQAPVQTQTTPSVSLPVLPPLSKFLPAGTDLGTTTFSQAITVMDESIAALEAFAANPTALGAQSSRDASLNEYYRNK